VRTLRRIVGNKATATWLCYKRPAAEGGEQRERIGGLRNATLRVYFLPISRFELSRRTMTIRDTM
jgi:hypothetical protein